MNANRPDLMSLANELLEAILSYDCLQHDDILSARLVSSRLYAVCKSHKLWKQKALNRWSHWHNVSNDNDNWYEIYKKRHCLEQILLKEMENLAEKCHEEQVITSDYYAGIDQIIAQPNPIVAISSAMECLEEFLDDNKCDKLTMRYYARLATKYLCHCRLEFDFCQFLALPNKEQSPELGFSLMAYWMTPSYKVDVINDVSQCLDQIAEKVAQLLQSNKVQLCLTHASFTRDDWITDHTESERILLAINQTLFTQLNFQGNRDNYYDEKNVVIDKVLENRYGTTLTICVIYMAVATRLGVNLEFVSFISHFMLRWLSDSSANEGERYKYVDVLDGGKLKTRQECLEMVSFPPFRTLEIVSTKELLCTAISNLVNELQRSMPYHDNLLHLQLIRGLNLRLVLDSDDSSIRFMYLYLLAQVKAYDVKIIQDTLEKGNSKVFQMTPQFERYLATLLQKKYEKATRNETVKLRSDYPQVVFRIGDTLYHKRYNFQCVVNGWDPVCSKGEMWIYQNGINQLSEGQNQPFYNVLGADGSERYVAQENLESIHLTELIHHPELGRYFNCFNMTTYTYEPNKQLRKRYLEDCLDAKE